MTSITSASESEPSDEFASSFAKVLNRHGYGFQFSILRKTHELINQNKCAWKFEVGEFPVEIQGAGTRIDFVLSRPPLKDNSTPLYLIAECKRANPALSRWCFAKAPYKHSAAQDDPQWDRVIMECVSRDDGGLKSFARETFSSDRVYHLATEMRSNAKGDPSGETGQAIENAATQVFRGMNGFIQTLIREPQIILEDVNQVDFLPVVFTTAELYVTSADMSLADLHTGNISLESHAVKSEPWLFYQYPLSPSLKHQIQSRVRGFSLATLLQWEYLRTVPIVSPSGIEEFLIWASLRLHPPVVL